MAKGNYIVSPLADNEINFQLAPNAETTIPEDQQDLIIQVEDTLEAIKTIYSHNSIVVKKYFDQLISLSQLGLVGLNAQPGMALKVLNQIKIEIVNKEGSKAKNKYLKKLAGWSITYAFPLLIFGLYAKAQLSHSQWTFLSLDGNKVKTLCFVWVGSMVGVWLSFAISRIYITFDELTLIEKDGLEPTLRLLFTGVISIVIAISLIMNVIVFQIGNISSASITEVTSLALFIGFLLGINEKILGSTFSKKSLEYISKL